MKEKIRERDIKSGMWRVKDKIRERERYEEGKRRYERERYGE